MKQAKRVGIIGGGAAGLMAAVNAAKHGAKVTVFERNDKIGKKILATGNGKCNFTNENMALEFYEGSVKEIFSIIYEQFNKDDLKNLFLLNGVLIKDKNGYLYPNTEQAATVVDLFRNLLDFYGIEVVLETVIKPENVSIQKGVIHIDLDGKLCKRNFVFDSLIITCGGAASPKTGSDGSGFDIAKSFGHKIVPVVPALVQLKCSDGFCKALAGVRSDAKLSMYIDGELAVEESGELQLTDYGISGIPVFQISRHASYALRAKKQVSVSVDFLKDYDEKALLDSLVAKWELYQKNPEILKKTTYEAFFHGLVNKKITMVFLKECGFKPTESIKDLSKGKLRDFVKKCKHFVFHVNGTNSFEQAQVSAGGIGVSEVNQNLSSKKVKNVYFAGEILDIDGKCGGYNLQWAFSSGAVAGKHGALD